MDGLSQASQYPSNPTMCEAISTLGISICHKGNRFRRSDEETRFLGCFHIQNEVLGYLSSFPIYKFTWRRGRGEGNLETFLGSSRSYQSLGCRFRRNDWFNVNA